MARLEDLTRGASVRGVLPAETVSESVQEAAVKCRYCREWLDEEARLADSFRPQVDSSARRILPGPLLSPGKPRLDEEVVILRPTEDVEHLVMEGWDVEPDDVREVVRREEREALLRHVEF
jgi:hypothetical protein